MQVEAVLRLVREVLIGGDNADRPSVGNSLYQLAYDEARRRLDAQERALDEIRQRSGVLVGTATIATSFLGSRLINSTDPVTAWPTLAVGSFVLCVVLACWILYPRGGWKFYFGTSKLITGYIENDSPLTADETLRDLAIHMEQNHADNGERLNRLYWGFVFAVVALMVEIGGWLAYLAGWT